MKSLTAALVSSSLGRRAPALLAIALFAVTSVCAQVADPVTSDPAVVDLMYPPRMESLRIPTAGGAKLNGIFYDILSLGAKLRSRPLLIISGSRDTDMLPLAETHEPMVSALKAAGAQRVESVVYDDDHPFSAHRFALARKVTAWLQAAMPARFP